MSDMEICRQLTQSGAILTLVMAKTTQVFIALLIGAFLAPSANAKGKRTLVEFWHTGDDGLSERLADQVERALARSPDFTISTGRKLGTLIVTIPTNVEWKQIGERPQLRYQVEFASANSGTQGKTAGSCWDNLSECAYQIVKATKVAAQKLH